MNREDIIILIATAMMILNPGIVMIVLQIMFLDVVSDFFIAILSTMYWIPIFLFASAWGRLADIIGDRRIVAILTQLVVGILTILHAFFYSYWEIFGLRFLTGVFAAAYTPAIQGYITTGSSRESFGEKLGVYNTGVALGFLLSGIVTSGLLFVLEVRLLFVFAGLFSIVASLIISILPRKEEIRHVKDVSQILSAISSLGTVRILTRYRAYLVVLALALRHVAVMGLFSVVFLYMQRIGIQKELLGILASINNIVQMILIIPLGKMATSKGYKKFYLPGFLLSAFIPFVFLFAVDIITVSIAFAYIGIAYSLLIAGVNPYLREAAPKGHESEVLSLVNTTRAFGMIFGPILVGALIDVYGYQIMFIGTTIVGLIATLLSTFSREIDNNVYE